MTKINNNIMTDYLLTFFVEDRAITRILSDVLKNEKDRMFLESLGLPPDFQIPFFQEERGASVIYRFKPDVNSRYEVIWNGHEGEEFVIHSGDYITFKRKDDDKTVKLLFVATSDIQVGYRKYKLPINANVFIGRTPSNDISFDFTDFISREKHAAIRVDGKGQAFIEDLKRSVGVYVNGRLTYSQQLKHFDEIFIMGLSIIYLGDYIAVRNLKMESTLSLMTALEAKEPVEHIGEKKYFVVGPRILKSLDHDEIEIEAPPSPFVPDSTPIVLTLGPSITMSMAMLASMGVSIAGAISGGQTATILVSATMAVSMLAGSIMWPSLLRNYQKKRMLEEEVRRKQRYSSYIAEIEKELSMKKERAVRLLNDSLCPSPHILYSMLDNEKNKIRLWERSYEDDDFLDVRIGLGERPFDVKIKIPKQGFRLYDDELSELSTGLLKKYSNLENVPLTLNIYNNRAIGVIGDWGNIYSVIDEMILNIISLHACDEVKLVLLSSVKQAQDFEIYKNVPHIWSNDKKVRFFATNTDEVHHVFGVIDEKLKEREDEKGRGVFLPHYVIIVMEPGLVEKEAMFRYMNDSENKVGITTIFAYGDITMLPKSCKTIIQSDSNRTGYYIKNENANRFIQYTKDPISRQCIREFVNKLSQLPVKRDSRSLGIVDRISFLQMYRVGNVEELNIERHWDNNNSAKSLAAPIGVMAGGELFDLDLHEAYHGCHGLVAGTTGSGKSEFLQAFILSLAINYSPREVAFVLVDFKGGDMARPFMAKQTTAALPHLSATISNLSGNILYRALVSLEAEIKARQRIFNESAILLGVDKLDINSYHKYYKGGRLDMPLPHLVIVIDEFAQLKTQQPEFLAQLINVAQVGRSLGIHLILATQKPSGIVDPQIMSNSRFKICLKVADKQDSIDMINRSDAALIKNPGRLYLQVGYDEIYECVQSGYSGADYIPAKCYMPDEEITVQMTDNTANPIHSARMELQAEKSDKTQLEAIVAEIVALGQKKKLAVKPLWLEVLSEKIVLNTLQSGKRGLCTATIGLADYVRSQEQKSLTINFAKDGHIAIYGASGTGKTTFLQTMVYSMICEYEYTPEELNLYVLDFGGRNLGYLSALPHTGGVVFAGEENKISELAVVLNSIIEERKRIFADNNCGTFADYRAESEKPLPAILVLIDNFASFRDKHMDVADMFVDFISAGKTFGVYFAITGNTRNSIYYKVTEHISTYYTLRMNDPNNYMEIHNMRPPVIPEDINGRGITVVDKEIVEFQTAIVYDGNTEAERILFITAQYSDIAEHWSGYTPITLEDAEPEQGMGDGEVTNYYELSKSKNHPPESVSDDIRNLILGTSKSGALMYGIILSEDYKVCVCANESYQLKEYYGKLLASMEQYGDRHIMFIDDGEMFREIVDEHQNFKYFSGVSGFSAFIEEMKPELNIRLEEPDMHHEPIFIIIPEFNMFFDMITDEQATFMRKVFRYITLPKYKIYFICGFNVNNNKNNDSLFMSLVVNAENYIICPNSYEEASAKIETIPLIHNSKPQGFYFCLKEKNVELRW